MFENEYFKDLVENLGVLYLHKFLLFICKVLSFILKLGALGI